MPGWLKRSSWATHSSLNSNLGAQNDSKRVSMSAEVQISVLINNRDNAPFLRRCVESVLEQSMPADEVIVYDDGSTDNSVAILEEFGIRIRVLQGAGGTG